MFCKLIARNSRRNWKENSLFFSSLLISVIAFYIILSLPHQDVMRFLSQMESYAVDRLLTLIPVFYCMALCILFFLIYYASKYQLERRRHEFGVYLMLGMRRSRLFALLLTEDLGSSLLSLLLGLPAAVLLSELISLITARLVGIGIVGHQITFSWQAVLWTAAGFVLIKFAAFLILSGKISRQEIGSLLVDTPDGAGRPMHAPVYAASLPAGILCLSYAYFLAICGKAWAGIQQMGLTLLLGILGTFLFFLGLRTPMGRIARSGQSGRRLRIFHLRQIQELVIHRSHTLAVCSLLMLAALCCFGAGIAISRFYGDAAPHVLDYTFPDRETEHASTEVRQTLAAHHLDTRFSDLFEMKIGSIHTTDDYEHAFQMEPVLAALQELPPSRDQEILLNNLSYGTYPHLISLDSYNHLRRAAGLPELELKEGEAAVYMDSEFTTHERNQILDQVLETGLEVRLDQDTIRLIGPLQTTDVVTDRSITLSFALILPDDRFAYYTQGSCNVYLNGILAPDETSGNSLLQTISDLNQELDRIGLTYESYLRNIGRQLFYMVAASYITLYLAVIFLIVANTIIGVQFLMGQQRSDHRYRTLVRLGADYDTLCRSAGKQIYWYFGLPAGVAAFGSLFGVRALFAGLLSNRTRSSLSEMMIISAAVIFVLCVIEWIYILAVKRSSDHWLLTRMTPRREE